MTNLMSRASEIVYAAAAAAAAAATVTTNALASSVLNKYINK